MGHDAEASVGEGRVGVAAFGRLLPAVTGVSWVKSAVRKDLAKRRVRPTAAMRERPEKDG
jgi:hypothetical protein